MAKTNYTCGIDIGTHTTRIVVLGFTKGNTSPSIIATGSAETNGMRLGYITDIESVTKSIKTAKNQIEKTLGSRISRAYLSVGGISLSSTITTGEAVISRADQEITQLDISKALAESESHLDIVNKKVIHAIPLSFKLDGKEVYGKPEGMHGVKLEVKTLFITSLKQHLEDLITALTLADIQIEDIIASPLAEATILLNQKQKAAGCALLNIGSETTTLSVYENNELLSLSVFQIGSMDITKDVALGFRIPLEEAEGVKNGTITGTEYPRKKVDEIIEARLGDVFELVSNHLKRMRRNELLPAGIIVSGGGAHIHRIEDIAKQQLRLPCRFGPSDPSINTQLSIRDASWYTAYGLALSHMQEKETGSSYSSTNDILKQFKEFLRSFFSQFLP